MESFSLERRTYIIDMTLMFNDTEYMVNYRNYDNLGYIFFM